MKSKLKIILLFIVGIISITAINVLRKDSAEHDKNKLIDNLISEDRQEQKQEPFANYLQKVSDDTNKKCPITINKYTRLDNTHILSGNTIQYNYTLVDFEKGEADIKLIEKEFTNTILNDVKTNPKLKILRDKNITITYYYKDKNGEFLYNFKVTPNMYK
ncbi:hypothetical protein [Snuella sedimenti]|uniref:Uncharacterized protein n=1 Tax=Snuella sedimenti TaxID=2798802 RepID=A0A8J7IQC3_9FLAO|nr:hypothetical protein [Snuella sedimenti]MBJ6369162.1 hypothetical protein [Snuella sedimenti]